MHISSREHKKVPESHIYSKPKSLDELNKVDKKVSRVKNAFFRSASLVTLGTLGAAVGTVAIGSLGFVSIVALGAAAVGGALIATTAGMIYFLAKDIFAGPRAQKKETIPEKAYQPSSEGSWPPAAIADAPLPDRPDIPEIIVNVPSSVKIDQKGDPNLQEEPNPLPLKEFQHKDENDSGFLEPQNQHPSDLTSSLLGSFIPGDSGSKALQKDNSLIDAFVSPNVDFKGASIETEEVFHSNSADKMMEEKKPEEEVKDDASPNVDDNTGIQKNPNEGVFKQEGVPKQEEPELSSLELSASWISLETLSSQELALKKREEQEKDQPFFNVVANLINDDVAGKSKGVHSKKMILDFFGDKKLNESTDFKVDNGSINVPNQFLRDLTAFKNLTLNGKNLYSTSFNDKMTLKARKRNIIECFYEQLGKSESGLKRVGTLVHQAFFSDAIIPIFMKIQGALMGSGPLMGVDMGKDEGDGPRPMVVEDVGDEREKGYDFDVNVEKGVLTLKATLALKIGYIEGENIKKQVGFVYIKRELSIPLKELNDDSAENLFPGLKVEQTVTRVCSNLEAAKISLGLDEDFVAL